jgi:hypothetical protein
MKIIPEYVIRSNLHSQFQSLPFAGISDYSAGLETAYKLIKAEKSVSIYKIIQRD